MLATLLIAIPLLANAPEIPVRAGTPVKLDGTISPGEWRDAFSIQRALPRGKKLEFHLKRNGPWLAVGISADRAYRGEILRLVTSDAAGSWACEEVFGLGQPSMPPAVWRRGPPPVLSRIPTECPRACRVRLDVTASDHWSAELLIALPQLGIGRGDLRSFRAFFGIGNATEGVLFALPGRAGDPYDPSGFARLVSPDGWGAGETWPVPDAALSRIYDDHELLYRLYMEYQRISTQRPPDQLVISDAVHPRSLARIHRLESELEAGQARNPTLPAWLYYRARLLHEGNLFSEAGAILRSLPPSLSSLPPFVRLEVEHYMDLEQCDKAEAICKAHPGPATSERLYAMVDNVSKAWKREQKARAVDEAKMEKNPTVAIVTAKGTIVCELFEDAAPNAVRNFIDLVLSRKFYDGLEFTPVTGGMIVRTGDPRTREGADTGSKMDGPGWRLRPDEHDDRPMVRGSLAMVPVEGGLLHGSQFVIAVTPMVESHRKPEVFGRVLKGQDVVDSLEEKDRLIRVQVLSKRNHDYGAISARVR